MIDQETEDVSAGPAGAPVNRDARREPQVIEGEIAGRPADDSDAPPDPSAAEPMRSPDPAPAARPARTGAHPFLGGALAGLVVSALCLGAGYTLLAPRGDGSETANRLNELEAQTQRDKAALAAESDRGRSVIAGLEKRIGALEAAGTSATDLGKRVAALEASAGAGNGAANDATQNLAAQEKDLRADVDAARGAIPDLSARIAKLEADIQKTNAASGDVAALAGRIDKVEAQVAAPKPETRSPADTAAAIAILADAAEGKLRAGEPLGADLATLQRLGVDAEKLAPLQAVVNGAPTNASLAASFSAVAPQVLAAASQKETGSIADRFIAHLHSLVRVRNLNETAGDDPQALASQIEAESRRGDIRAALASFDKLPQAARQAAGDWPALARLRQAADAALELIREAAVGQLASGSKP